MTASALASVICIMVMLLPAYYAAAAAAPAPAPAAYSHDAYRACKQKAADRILCGPSAFTFYLHNTVYNPTVDNKDYFNSVYGLSPNVTWPNPYSFGTTSTFEDPLTEGPANTSQQIGVAQGLWQLNSKVGYTLFHIFTANITDGDYKGTISILGQIREVDPVRYLTVVGGTGDFLGARGLATNRLVTIDHTAPATWTLSFDLDLYY
ncbi:hypothetical protein GOP47_0021889 [Adiantum capillus-veneris]|uniref:Dirigent protein n=1 Tax=Adiantum capillus-veneris TaxID=13818 RepID=A0A9D4U973_ADICA|nr:hypothetical protein GOP47_0021889 [Adiantum capillus-veneris]